jgi:hypothetical protein
MRTMRPCDNSPDKRRSNLLMRPRSGAGVDYVFDLETDDGVTLLTQDDGTTVLTKD